MLTTSIETGTEVGRFCRPSQRFPLLRSSYPSHRRAATGFAISSLKVHDCRASQNGGLLTPIILRSRHADHKIHSVSSDIGLRTGDSKAQHPRRKVERNNAFAP